VTRRILAVDDDPHIREVIRVALRKAEMTVTEARDGREALARLAADRPDLIILDIGMPELDGLDVCRQIRKSSDVPILFLTARDDEIDRVLGLEIGGDDYVTKPFSPRELVARVRALHRRAVGAVKGVEAPGSFSVDDLELVPSARQVLVRGEEIKLTTAEYDLLEALVKQAGAVVSREDLTRVVLGRKLAAFDRAIDMHVSNLRKKLGPGPDGAERIKTVRNAGYILVKAGR